MKITEKVTLPTSCRFLDGMEWTAAEHWHRENNNPDALEERMVFITTEMNGVMTGICLNPCEQLSTLRGKEFDPLRDHPEFIKLCERVKALVVTKPKG